MRIPLKGFGADPHSHFSQNDLVISLATISQKGGVGKTTISINLAHAFARRGFKTLLVDTDPQGGIGMSLSKSTKFKRGFFDFLSNGGEVSSYTLKTRLPEFCVMPSGEPIEMFSPEQANSIRLALKTLLSEAQHAGFDLVMFDTSAGMSALNETLIQASDYALIPQQAEPLAARSLPRVLETLSRFKREGHRIKIAGIVLTMLLEHHEASLRVAEELKELLPSALLCEVTIPRDNLFLEASAVGLPIHLVRKNPPPLSLKFDQLASELEKKLHLTQPQSSASYESLLD